MSIDLGNTPVGTPPTAPEQAQIRSAIGLGALSTQSTVTSSQISDSTVPGRAVLTGATAAAQRTSLGLGTIATQDSASYLASDFGGNTNITTVGTVTAGTWSAGTIALAKGGTGASTASGARAALELTSLATLAIPGNTTTYLRGDGTWVAVSGSVNLASPGPIGNTVPSTIAATDLVVNGNTNWTIGCTFTYGDSTASAAHRTALGLGTLATVSPTGTANATTYLRGDGSWATVTGSGGGFVGIANRIIIGGSGTNADGSIENTLAATGTSASVNNAILAVPAAVGTTNVNLVLSPKGTGAIIAGPAPDGGVVGGNARGVGAADFQLVRSAATQVASGTQAFASGSGNTASGAQAFASGSNNIASGAYSFAGGNISNAGGTYSMAFGQQNTVVGKSAICLGRANTTNGTTTDGMVAIGKFNAINGEYGDGCFAIGRSNIVTVGEFILGAGAIGYACAASSIAGLATGLQSKADRLSQFSHASGQFAAVGDAQRSNFVLRCATSLSPSTAEMALDGGTTYLTIPSGKTMAFIAHIAGTKVGGTLAGDVDACYFIRKGIIRNQNGTISLVGAVVEETVYAGTGGTNTCVVDAFETAVDYLRVRVATPWTSTQTWRWVANVEVIEIGHV